jgi:hypothetical protein
MSDFEEIKKYNLEECIVYFKANLFQDEYLSNFRFLSLNGEIEKNKIRNMTWRIFLNVFSQDETISDWIETLTKQREEYKTKLKTLLKTPKLQGDPLGGASNSNNEEWKKYYIEKDMKDLIKLDLSRTYQELKLFHDEKIVTMLSNILFIWSQENIDLGYKQGMNDLLSIIFLAFYPFYYPNDTKNTKEDLIKFSSQFELAMKHSKDLYLFFNDENNFESDLYFTFNNLMKKGMKDLYDLKENDNKKINYKKYELFENEWTKEQNDDFKNPLLIRCSLIIKEKLKKIDPLLYQHFENIQLNTGIVLQRWLKCIFCREYDLNEIFILWDAIFANEDDNNYPLIFIDFIAIAMIINIRNELFEGGQTECFSYLFKYPHQDNIIQIIKISERIKNSIDLINKNKNVSINEIITGEKDEEIQDKNPKSIIKNLISDENLKTIENTMKKGGEILTEALNSVGGFFNKIVKKDDSSVNINNPHDANEKLFNLLKKYSGKMSKDDYREFYGVVDYLKKNFE